MKKHFEHLWEEAENFEPSLDSKENIREFLLKAQLIESIKDKESFNILFGEILYSLAKISKCENINVYKALNNAIKNKND